VTFELRVVHMEDGRVERGAYDTQPELPQAADVVRLMRAFLSGKPVQFRDRIPFLKQGNIDIEWVASEDGVAFATFYLDGEATTMAVLARDPNSEAGQGVLQGFRKSLGLGAAEIEPIPGALAVMATMPGSPEWFPTLHLLNTSLAAVYFGR
jgi:hypothetical protein